MQIIKLLKSLTLQHLKSRLPLISRQYPIHIRWRNNIFKCSLAPLHDSFMFCDTVIWFPPSQNELDWWKCGNIIRREIISKCVEISDRCFAWWPLRSQIINSSLIINFSEFSSFWLFGQSCMVGRNNPWNPENSNATSEWKFGFWAKKRFWWNSYVWNFDQLSLCNLCLSIT